ncbi:MAG: hypothetical protein PUJ59_00475, partial [Clostridiaceae bacterium]|nr:hypothetical protein [Clostridiaceae bacterium]MDY5889799.1 hypothetical protein [Oscillospiraceae bacterium]
LFFYSEEDRKGQLRSNRNSPVDCFGARVRADRCGSRSGDPLRLHQKKTRESVLFSTKFAFGE